MIEQISCRIVPCHHVRKLPVSGLGPTHPQLITLLPHHLREMPSVALETRFIESVVFDFTVPHVCRFISSCFKPAREHGDVLTISFTFLLRSVLQFTCTCQFLGPGLCFLCNLVRPRQWRHFMLGAVFVVSIKGLFCKTRLWHRAGGFRSSLKTEDKTKTCSQFINIQTEFSWQRLEWTKLSRVSLWLTV